MNRLAQQASLYLQQHAKNSVHWYPWGKEAFVEAQKQNKLIFLSIGYAACHWCHVMAHESFEDQEIATLLNEHFISIKVDREEYPVVDQLYQNALQLITRQSGGWPLSMFLLSDGKPVFGGTYFPKEPRYGLPSFRQVLETVPQLWMERKEQLAEQGESILSALMQLQQQEDHQIGKKEVLFSVKEMAEKLCSQMDPVSGGFQGAPKFPQPMVLSFLLRQFARSQDPQDAKWVILTLEKMAEGGIFDQLFGGFARYSTDAHWLIPHFEKMLYDNALLLKVYAEGYQVAHQFGYQKQKLLFLKVLHKTIFWLKEQMLSKEGGFYASMDADSEGVEGKYYVWSKQEIEELVAKEISSKEERENAVEVFCQYYGVTEEGNFFSPHEAFLQGKNILHINQRFADQMNPQQEKILTWVESCLVEARKNRVPPVTDTKIITSWNGLLLTGLAYAAKILSDSTIWDLAEKTADFFLKHVWIHQGEEGEHPTSKVLYRIYGQGQARIIGTLEDYALLAEGIFHLIRDERTSKYLTVFHQLIDDMIDCFYDDSEKTFRTLSKHAVSVEVPLVLEPKSLIDQAIPSALSVACLNLLRLAALLPFEQAEKYQSMADRILKKHQQQVINHPFGMTNLGAALDLSQQGLSTVILSVEATKENNEAAELFQNIVDTYMPDPFVFTWQQQMGKNPPAFAEGKEPVSGKMTAYFCHQTQCFIPVTSATDWKKLL